MTDEATNTDESAGTETSEDSGGPKELRAALDREKQRRMELENKLADQAFETLGLKRDEGIGKAIDKLFEGDKTDATSIEAFARDEFNWQPQQAQESTPQQALTQPPQQRVDQATAGGVPVEDGSIDRAIQKATSEGRWADVVALQMKQARDSGLIGSQ